MSPISNVFAVITANQYRDAMHAVSCQRAPVPSYPVSPDSFRAGLLVGLHALAVGSGHVIDLSKIDPAALASASKNLNEAIEGKGLRLPDLDQDTFQAVVAYLLEQILTPAT